MAVAGANYRVVDTGTAPYEVLVTCAGCGVDVWVGCVGHTAAGISHVWVPPPGWRCSQCMLADQLAALARRYMRPVAPPEPAGPYTARAQQLGLLE